MPVQIENTFWAKFYWLLENNNYSLKDAWMGARDYTQARHHLTDLEIDEYSQSLWETFLTWC